MSCMIYMIFRYSDLFWAVMCPARMYYAAAVYIYLYMVCVVPVEEDLLCTISTTTAGTICMYVGGVRVCVEDVRGFEKLTYRNIDCMFILYMIRSYYYCCLYCYCCNTAAVEKYDRAVIAAAATAFRDFAPK